MNDVNDPDAGIVVAVDVGGTSIKGALVSTDLRVIHTLRLPTPVAAGPMAVSDAIAGTIRMLVDAAGTTPLAAGVVVPGIVDEDAGVARLSSNLGWRDLALRDLLAEATNLHVALGHDVRAGALAECEIGAARGVDDLLFLPIGTGVGGAAMIGGHFVGGRGYAGEIGHLVVEPDGDQCPCGGRGCLETVASARALVLRYAARTGIELDGADEIRRRVEDRDPEARRVWDEAVTALAVAIAGATVWLAPEVVVIGGGLSLSGDTLLDPLRREVAHRLPVTPVPRIVAAALGDQAGCLGAALLALGSVGRR